MRPKIFIGSSRQNVEIAKILRQQLVEQVDVEANVWDEEGVFNLNRGFLEDLLNLLDEFDFAVFVLAADDVTLSKSELSFSPRDNVVLELGLFMGRLGRDRVFVAYDDSIDLKRPSDLDGVTFASYDGSRVQDSTSKKDEGLFGTSRRIADEIKKTTLLHIAGEWRSKYRLTGEANHPLAEEDVQITPIKTGICITSKTNSQNDSYVARANEIEQRLFLGKWKATAQSGSTNGIFMLSANRRGTFMYGYATGLSETSGTIFTAWLLAKKDGAGESEILERLKRGEELLKRTLLPW